MRSIIATTILLNTIALGQIEFKIEEREPDFDKFTKQEKLEVDEIKPPCKTHYEKCYEDCDCC